MAYSSSGGGGREGEMVNSNIPPRIKNLLFRGQSQQTLPLCASVCSSFVFSFVLSSSPCLLGLSVSLISHCIFFRYPSSPSPTVIFSLLSVSHPPLTPPFLLISPSVSPRAFCSHFLPISLIHLLSSRLISEICHWLTALAC